ncbi:MAG TPA: metallophosphoesterase family protein [Candidatus Limnocylindrales bacterium]|nr:metallophosphoesterase family protein [Candidatus Limnocylindrales bacterium]
MRVAVLSDIHANLPALDAVLAAAGPVDEVWHLGDVVGYGPDPDAVVARLRDLGARGVQGNHDLAATGDDVIRDFNVDARAAMEWTRRVISPATRDWLAGLPPRLTIGGWSLVHGSPRDPTWEYIVTQEAAAENLAVLPSALGFFGHTHLPIAYVLDRDTSQPARDTIGTLTPEPGTTLSLVGRQALVNPGSAGQPRDGDPRASGLVLDLATSTVTWIRAAYNIAATQRAMRAAGLPARGISRLTVGI